MNRRGYEIICLWFYYVSKSISPLQIQFVICAGICVGFQPATLRFLVRYSRPSCALSFFCMFSPFTWYTKCGKAAVICYSLFLRWLSRQSRLFLLKTWCYFFLCTDRMVWVCLAGVCVLVFLYIDHIVFSILSTSLSRNSNLMYSSISIVNLNCA